MEQNVFLTKMIGIIVAVIVTAVVLMPICNSLTEGDGGSGGETVLVTNSGEYYYNDVGKDIGATTYTFPTSLTEDDLKMANIAVNGTSVLEYPMPEWVSETAFDVVGTSVPLFIFKTADGKYGVEGVSAGGVSTEDGDTFTDAEEITANAGLIYYRYILGEEEVSSAFSFMSLFLNDVTSNSPTVTIDNGTVSYSGFAEGNLESLNGEYLLRLSDSKTEGDYCLADNNQSDSQMFVASDTEMYMWNIFGSVYVETDDDVGSIVTREGCTSLFGAGTVDTIASNSEAFNKWENGLTFEVVKTTADNGLLSISSMEVGGNDQNYFGRYIVPTKITESSSESGSDLGVAGTILAVVPIFVVLGILMYAVQYLRDPRKL